MNRVPTKVYFILSGEAYASNHTGRYIYFKLLKGSYFGVSHLLAGKAWSYSLWYDQGIGANCFTVPSDKFLSICRKYPDTLRKLVLRSKKRRTLFRQYKFESLKDIITLAINKESNLQDEWLRESLYVAVLKKLSLNNSAAEYAKNRIMRLKNIAKQRLEKINQNSSDEDK